MGLWAKMPRTMVTKCAEALAIRKAFPAQLSGLYTDDEMNQAAQEPAQTVPVVQAKEIPQETSAAPQPVPLATKTPVKKAAVKKTENVQEAETVPGSAEPPAKIDGKWYARLDKCTSKAEVETLGRQYELELNENPALKGLFREYYKSAK